MELILGTLVAIVLAIILWNLRKAFFSQSAVWRDKVELNAKESASDLQEDYKGVIDRISAVRKANGDKWYGMSDIDDLMK